MGLLRYGLILGFLAFLAHVIVDKLHSKLPLHFDGHVEKGYENIRTAFEQNFLDGWEAEGASFAVFLKGKKVVDIWGGYADKQAARIWKEGALPYFDTPITEEMARDHNLMRKVIENETPKRPAGQSSGYHLLTYGWLVDQIIRHTDEKHRGVGQFLREEITKSN
ncbi:hypothetical protein TELCIR_17921, partial [Teladorsagia circumcincta]